MSLRTALCALFVLLSAPCAACPLHPDLQHTLDEIEERFAPVTVTSTCGGKHAAHSYHYRGLAVDFRVHKNIAGVASFVRGTVPGSHHYGGRLFHVDMAHAKRLLQCERRERARALLVE